MELRPVQLDRFDANDRGDRLMRFTRSTRLSGIRQS
jgi:hypothetical protein